MRLLEEARTRAGTRAKPAPDLSEAAKGGDLAGVKAALAAGADVNAENEKRSGRH
jgi:hypothetical protein